MGATSLQGDQCEAPVRVTLFRPGGIDPSSAAGRTPWDPEGLADAIGLTSSP